MSLLHSLRAFKLPVPFTFDSDKAGFDIGKWSKIEQSVVEPKIHFIASTDFENIDFFQNITRNDSDYDFSNLQVYINGELTDQVADSISANANDDIVIKATNGKYPWFGSSVFTKTINYIKSIEEPLPLMYKHNGDKVTSLNHCFSSCFNLISIPAKLFENNPQVENFGNCFYRCFGLVNIPEDLFSNCLDANNFANCFYECSSLTNIPIGLFDNNTKVINFSSCFQGCSNLTVNVQIGSTASPVDANNFAGNTKEKGTVYCKEGSAAYTAFSESTNANVNVLTY